VLHYLGDEPVLACAPSTGYRFRKFARKHRTVLTTAAAFVQLHERPVHVNEGLKPGAWRGIVRDAGLSDDDL
jgi:hypothetical protein